MKHWTKFNFMIYYDTPSKLLQVTVPLHAGAATNVNFTLGKFGNPKDDVLSALLYKSFHPLAVRVMMFKFNFL